MIFRNLMLVLILVISTDVFAEKAKTTPVPWDTVIAKMQVIDSMNQPDSVKSGLTQELFSDYNLKADDYINFYNKFFERPPDRQVKFLKKVEEIILELMNRQYRQDK